MQQSEQIEHRLLSPKDWPDIKDSVLKLEEELFSGTDLQEDDESFARTFTSPDLIAYAAEVGNKLVGFVAGGPADTYAEEFRDEDTGKLLYHFDEIGHNSAYITAREVRPSLQNRGIGGKLFDLFTEEAKRRGYSSVSGHARDNASIHTVRKHKPQIEVSCHDYWGTGETYVFYKLLL